MTADPGMGDLTGSLLALPPDRGVAARADVWRASMADSMGVLVVEDDPDIRYLLRVLIELDPDLRLVGEASTIGDAIAEARRLEPGVVVLDLGLDGHDALGAIPVLLRVAPASRIVVYTARPIEVRREALAAGASGFVSKAELPHVLIDELRRHAGRRPGQPGHLPRGGSGPVQG